MNDITDSSSIENQFKTNKKLGLMFNPTIKFLTQRRRSRDILETKKKTRFRKELSLKVSTPKLFYPQTNVPIPPTKNNTLYELPNSKGKMKTSLRKRAILQRRKSMNPDFFRSRSHLSHVEVPKKILDSPVPSPSHSPIPMPFQKSHSQSPSPSKCIPHVTIPPQPGFQKKINFNFQNNSTSIHSPGAILMKKNLENYTLERSNSKKIEELSNNNENSWNVSLRRGSLGHIQSQRRRLSTIGTHIINEGNVEQLKKNVLKNESSIIFHWVENIIKGLQSAKLWWKLFIIFIVIILINIINFIWILTLYNMKVMMITSMMKIYTLQSDMIMNIFQEPYEKILYQKNISNIQNYHELENEIIEKNIKKINVNYGGLYIIQKNGKIFMNVRILNKYIFYMNSTFSAQYYSPSLRNTSNEITFSKPFYDPFYNRTFICILYDSLWTNSSLQYEIGFIISSQIISNLLQDTFDKAFIYEENSNIIFASSNEHEISRNEKIHEHSNEIIQYIYNNIQIKCTNISVCSFQGYGYNVFVNSIIYKGFKGKLISYSSYDKENISLIINVCISIVFTWIFIILSIFLFHFVIEIIFIPYKTIKNNIRSIRHISNQSEKKLKKLPIIFTEFKSIDSQLNRLLLCVTEWRSYLPDIVRTRKLSKYDTFSPVSTLNISIAERNVSPNSPKTSRTPSTPIFVQKKMSFIRRSSNSSSSSLSSSNSNCSTYSGGSSSGSGSGSEYSNRSSSNSSNSSTFSTMVEHTFLYIKINRVAMKDESFVDIVEEHKLICDVIFSMVNSNRGEIFDFEKQYILADFKCTNHALFAARSAIAIIKKARDRETILKRIPNNITFTMGLFSTFEMYFVSGNVNKKKILLSSNSKYYCKEYAEHCNFLKGVNILMDENTAQKLNTNVRRRIVDYVYVGEVNSIRRLYNLVDEIEVKSNEWMYELKQKERIVLFDKFNLCMYNILNGKDIQIGIQEITSLMKKNKKLLLEEHESIIQVYYSLINLLHPISKYIQKISKIDIIKMFTKNGLLDKSKNGFVVVSFLKKLNSIARMLNTSIDDKVNNKQEEKEEEAHDLCDVNVEFPSK